VARLEGQSASAEQLIRKAVSIEPKSGHALRALGRLQFTQSKFGEAEKTFKQLVALNPNDPSGYIDLAENYLRGAKNYPEAERAYRNAIRTAPQHVGAHMGLASALAARGDLGAAAEEYRTAGKLDPNNPLPWQRLGLLYAQHAKFPESIEALDSALEVGKRMKAVYVPALVDRGDVHWSAGDRTKAVADYRAAAQADPKNPVVLLKLGTALQAEKNWAEAEKALLAAIESDPKLFVAYNNLAWMAVQRKEKLDEALRWSKKSIELAPKESALYDTLGTVHRARGEKDLAVAAWEKAAALKPPHATYLYRLGLAYADAGRPKDAVRALKEALQGGDFPEAAQARQQLQKLAGAQ